MTFLLTINVCFMGSRRQVYWNWFLLSLFYSYQYLLRVYPGTFTNEIRETFNFSANDFVTLSTYCLTIYSCCQIPFGILLDKIGVRWLVLFSFALCIVGQHIFTHSIDPFFARFGRILIGIGAAPAFMSVVKQVSSSFRENLCGLFIGITCTLGTIFIILGNTLLQNLYLKMQGWREAAGCLNGFGLFVFILCLLSLSTENEKRDEQGNKQGFLKNFLSVALDIRMFLFALLTIGTCAIVTTLSDLWGKTFLITKYHLPDVQATAYNQFIFAGFLVGSLLIPFIFSEGKKVLNGVRICSASLAVLFFTLIYGPSELPTCLLQAMLFLLGVFGCADILCFTLAAQTAKPGTSGLVVGWINTINMLGLTLLQAFVAKILDRCWDGTFNAQGLRLYRADDYELALGILLNTAIVALIVACILRTKHMRTQK